MGNLPLIELPSVNSKSTETSNRGKEKHYAPRTNGSDPNSNDIKLPSVKNKGTEINNHRRKKSYAIRTNINQQRNFYRTQIRNHRKKNIKLKNCQARSPIISQSKIHVSRHQPYLRLESELLKEREEYLTFVHNTLNQVDQIGTLV